MLYPIIDIGSNTVKLSVLDSEQLFTAPPVFFKAQPLGLRSRVADGALLPDAIEELCELLKEYRAIAERLTREEPITFATASLRGLKNQAETVKEIREKTGLVTEVLSGETEAYFSFLGARGGKSHQAGCVVDLGGGSTEILSFRGKKVLKSVSIPFGCLTLYHSYFARGEEDYDSCRKAIRGYFQNDAPVIFGKHVLLSGGSAKAMLKYKNALAERRNSRVTRLQMDHILYHYTHGREQEIEEIRNLLKDRYPLIPPAVCVFQELCDLYGVDEVKVSKNGVREGCLFYHLQKKK